MKITQGGRGDTELYFTQTKIIFNTPSYEKYTLGLFEDRYTPLWHPCEEYTDDNIQYYFNMAVLNMVNGFLNTGEY